MPSSVTVTGVAGSLEWGYHQAAALVDWTVTKTVDGWSLQATVVSQNQTYLNAALAAGALTFVAPHQDGSWRWPVVALQITGARLSASLGPKE